MPSSITHFWHHLPTTTTERLSLSPSFSLSLSLSLSSLSLSLSLQKSTHAYVQRIFAASPLFHVCPHLYLQALNIAFIAWARESASSSSPLT